MTSNKQNENDRPLDEDMEIPSGIIRLEIQNVKRIKTAIIEPDGPVVVIGGRNGAGKSSAIDSIAYAFGGKALCPDVPLRRGQKRGFTKVTLDEFTVTRFFTPGGSRLEIKTTKGFTPPGGPQELLDKFLGKTRLEFDPMAFLDKSRADQLEVVKKLAGVNCDDLDEKRDKAFSERTDVNKKVKALTARIEGAPRHEDAPAEEVSVANLLAELDRRRDVNEGNEEQRYKLKAHNNGVTFLVNRIDEIEAEIEMLEAKRKLARNELEGLQAKANKQRAVVDALQDEDTAEVRQQIDASEETNRCVRENKACAAMAAELNEVNTSTAALTEMIDACDAEKKERIAAANLPVEGLAFDKDCVTFDDLPLDQASQAEQTRVVVAIALALSGKLRVALVRGGSLLDDDSLALLRSEVKAARGQLWLEHARAGSDATVVFEDGEIIAGDNPLPF